MKNKSSVANLIAILSIAFLANGSFGINPVLQKIMEAYPTVARATIMLVSTVPSVCSMVIVLLIGSVVGRKLKYKTVVTTGMLLFIIGGVLPFMFDAPSFELLLFSRVLFGMSLGAFGCRNAIIITLFEGEQRAKVLGYATLIQCLGGIAFQLLSGFLGEIGLKYSFLTYLITLVPFILMLLLFQDPGLQKDESKEKQKVVIKKEIIFYMIGMMAGTILLYPLLSNMSSYIKFKDLGSSAVSGTILSLYTIGGAVGGAFFGKVYGITKKYIAFVSFGMIAIGQAVVLYTNTVFLIAAGTLICGIGFFFLIPMFMMFAGIVADKNSVPFATALLLAASQGGSFLSSYWISFSGKVYGDVLIGPYLGAMIIFGLLAVIFLIVNPVPKSKSIINDVKE